MNIDTGGKTPPRVWVIDAYRAGERDQILALAEALAWPFETKHLQYRRFAARTNLFRGSDLSGIDPDSRAQLRAPWPDLIISAGMRNEPVCRWIRAQNDGASRIVHVGRPWANPHCFDLVVTTPQYRLPNRENVLQNSLTMHQVQAQRIIEAAETWRGRLGDLPAPYLSVILGGNSGPFTLGPRAGSRLAEEVNATAARLGASVLITTSARTSSRAVDAMEAALDCRYQLYRWRPKDKDNPYLAYLGLATELIVTADSISMLSEACATGRPVRMFDLNTGAQAMHSENATAAGGNDFRVSAFGYRALMRWGPRRLSRDIGLIHQRLVAEGQATWIGDKPLNCSPTPPRDLQRAVARIRQLMG